MSVNLVPAMQTLKRLTRIHLAYLRSLYQYKPDFVRQIILYKHLDEQWAVFVTPKTFVRVPLPHKFLRVYFALEAEHIAQIPPAYIITGSQENTGANPPRILITSTQKHGVAQLTIKGTLKPFMSLDDDMYRKFLQIDRERRKSITDFKAAITQKPAGKINLALMEYVSKMMRSYLGHNDIPVELDDKVMLLYGDRGAVAAILV